MTYPYLILLTFIFFTGCSGPSWEIEDQQTASVNPRDFVPISKTRKIISNELFDEALARTKNCSSYELKFGYTIATKAEAIENIQRAKVVTPEKEEQLDQSAFIRFKVENANPGERFGIYYRYTNQGIKVYKSDLAAEEISNNMFFFYKFVVGQSCEFILRSNDSGKLSAFQYVPYPIVARNNAGKQISAIVMEPTRQYFEVKFEGFPMGEELLVTQRSEDKLVKDLLVIPPNGILKKIVDPSIEGQRGGEWSLEVTSPSLEQALSFTTEWGALTRFTPIGRPKEQLEITKGKTTEAEVFAALGSPIMVSRDIGPNGEGADLVAYTWSCCSEKLVFKDGVLVEIR